MIKDRIKTIKKRISQIEPVTVPLEWPPREGSFSYCIWKSLSEEEQQIKRSFDDFYMRMAEEHFKNERSED